MSRRNVNPEAEAHNKSLMERGRDLLHKRSVAAGVAFAVGAGALAGCDANAEAPTPTETVTVTADPTETPTIEPTVEPTAEPTETDPTNPGEVDLRTPLFEGPFGNEYAPLHSDEILELTVPLEQLRAMDYVEFAKQPIQDRMNYLITKIEELGHNRNVYFGVDENFVADLAVYSWENANASAFYADTPGECAKLSIANNIYTTDINTGEINDASRNTAENWKSMCEAKTEFSNWVTGLYLSEEVSIREEQLVSGFTTPQMVSVLRYDQKDDGTVVNNRAVEAVELTIKRPDGQAVVVYAQGLER